MDKLIKLAAICCSIIGVASVAQAQTPNQVNRLDLMAQYTIETAVCPKLGFTVTRDPDLFAELMVREAKTTGLDPEIAAKVYNASLARRRGQFEVEMEAAFGATKADQIATQLRPFFLKEAQLCVDAARDPVFSRFVKPPANFNLQQAALDAGDTLLEAGGLASWQTPKIQARGDLLTMAGACRRHIGSERSDALFKEFSSATAVRERNYYVKAFQNGQTDPSLADFTPQQCERALTSFRAKATAP